MAFVFIEEVGGPLRVCSKQKTAEALGTSWSDIDLSTLDHAPHFYTLVDGAPVLLQDDLDTHLAEEEQEWVKEEMVYTQHRIAELEDGDPRGRADIASWRSYRKALRDRVQGGRIVGTRPERPA